MWLDNLKQISLQAEATMRGILCPNEPNKNMTQSALNAKKVATQIKAWESNESLEC